MGVLGLLAAGLAAVLHGYIFVLESLRWTDDRTRKVFGTTPEEAYATRQLAFNQGFYNLFLAIVTVIGILIMVSGAGSVGLALILAGTGSMLAAALVLLISSPQLARSAIIQGVTPAIAVVALVLQAAWS